MPPIFYQPNNTMNNNKVPYEAPEVEPVEIQAEGMVCASGGDPQQYSNPFGDELKW